MAESKIPLAKQVEQLTRQIERKENPYDYVRIRGNDYVICVSQLSVEMKNDLRNAINDIINNKSQPSIRELRSQRRHLLHQILKENR